MTQAVLKVAAWSSLAIPLYVYLGYPVLIDLLARIRPRASSDQSADGRELPLVTVIIPAHDEEYWIAFKIENTLALDYPRDRMHILVASDGSTDDTVGVARRFGSGNVEVIDYPERAGKMATLNRVVHHAHGEILVFTDAKAQLRPDALRKLIPHFMNPQVGGVTGDRICATTGSLATAGEGLYWRYERWIRLSESRFYSSLGACGQIYSVRRSLFPFVPGFSDDTVIPWKICISSRATIVFEPDALASIPAAATLTQEWERKVRSHLAFFYDLAHLKEGLNPFTSKIWWQLWSHHVFRLFVPWALLVVLATSPWIWSEGRIYHWLLYIQIAFYLAALVGLVLVLFGIRWKPAYVCFYFLLANAAVGYAWIQRLQGKKQQTWRQVDRAFLATESIKE